MTSNHDLTAEDRLAILDLMARYSWAYDDGNAEAYAAVFTPDGILADEFSILGTGRDEIKQALKLFIDQRGSDLWRHYNDQHLFEVGPDRVRIRSYWMVVSTNISGESHVLGQGRYVTEVQRLHGEWLIARRTFSVDRKRVQAHQK
ncbi:MAG: nuclear transport factor 2 family protein [Sphingobium sp.]|nr:nuclear transport factor 2 family protein [Sphingobium sp.]